PPPRGEQADEQDGQPVVGETHPVLRPERPGPEVLPEPGQDLVAAFPYGAIVLGYEIILEPQDRIPGPSEREQPERQCRPGPAAARDRDAAGGDAEDQCDEVHQALVLAPDHDGDPDRAQGEPLPPAI